MNKLHLYFLASALAFVGISCSSDDDNPAPAPEGDESAANYVITATPVALEGVADYILTTEDLSEGSISLVGNGVEQDGTYRYYITNQNKFFSLLYGQGNPGAVTTYQLGASGVLNKLSDFQAETVQSFTNVDDEVLMTKISRNSESPYADWFRLDANTSQFVGEGQINTSELAPGTEQAFFTWMTQVGDKIYAPFMSVKACCNDAFGTEYPDQAWIAVYNYPEMELEKIIEDDRTSFIGRYFVNGLGVDEKGDTYAFSSSIAASNSTLTSTKPSAVTRIKAGETEFDQSYFFNLEEASGDYYVTNQFYMQNGKFLLFMEANADRGSYSTGKKLAIVDVYDQSLNWVTGTPDEDAIATISVNNYVSPEDQTIYVGITTENGSYIYNINANDASATKGIEVEGGTITAISRLEPVTE
ncbi:MAG TPA: DUF4374 domain-containing protein [Leeuwenhoekiella sp.]|nr:DUF4374 domain-containing protein [Leeuwenhoekiella sp.]